MNRGAARWIPGGLALLGLIALVHPAAAEAAPSGFDPVQVHRKILQTAAFAGLSYVVLFILVKLINRRVRDLKSRHTLRKNTVYVVNILMGVGILLIWMQNIGSVAVLFGVLSAGLALALQEALLCMAGWLLILVRRPFELGDRIEIDGIRGDVIDIRLFQTSLLEIGNWVEADQSTGRIVNFPNSFVFKHANFNYSRGFEFIWNEIRVLITFESDWRKARDLMLALSERVALGDTERMRRKIEIMKNRYMIYYGKLTPIVYTAVKDSGVELTLRYLCEAKQRRSTEDLYTRALLEAFEAHEEIRFAYPTYRIVKT